jgi:dethiobiotin synthetase
MKPFETGLPVDRTELFPCDAKSLKDASGSTDSLAVINPVTFEQPLAPETAAQLERKAIDLAPIDQVYQKIVRSHDITLVEGAGGILVPILNGFFFADLIARWALPTVVVSRLGLGTINHTLLTCRTLQAQGVKVIGVILNDADGTDDVAARTNPDMLRKYLNLPVLGVVPYLGASERDRLDRNRLADIAAAHIDTKLIYDGAVLQSP